MSRANGETAELSEMPRLPIGWSWSRLDSVCDIAVGFAFKSAEFATHGIRLLRGENLEPGAFRWNDVRHWPEDKAVGFEHLFVQEGDIILAMDRPVISSGLKIAYAKPHDLPCLLVQRMARLRVKQVMTSPFAYAVMQTQRFINHLQGGQTGTQLPHVSTKGIGTFPIPVPPLNEQRRIVAKIEELFSDLEAGVAALTRARENLKRYRASVLKAAVEGALTAEWRTQHPQVEPASKLLERLLTERRRQWEADQLAKFAAAGKQPPNNWQAKYAEPAPPDTTNLPALPDGWCWAKLETVADVVGGITKDQKRANEPGVREVPYLRVANVQRGFLDLSEMKNISASDSDVAALRLEKGDVLFTEGGDRDKLGRGWVWSGELPECIHQNHIFRARLFTNEMQPRFVSHHGNTFGRVWFTKAGKQTTNLASINMGILRRFPVPVPPAAEQQEIVKLLDEKLSQIESAEVAIEHSLRRAARLRQSILKQAFEGKLVPQDPTDEPASTLLERIRVRTVNSTTNSDANIANESRQRTRRTTE